MWLLKRRFKTQARKWLKGLALKPNDYVSEYKDRIDELKHNRLLLWQLYDIPTPLMQEEIMTMETSKKQKTTHRPR